MHSLDNPTAYLVGLALLLLGGVLVLSSFFALGFTGTFLGKTPRAGGLETTLSRSRGEAGAADCPAARDVCVSLRPPSLLQASACAWLAQEAGLSYLIQQLGCQPRQGISVLCLGHKPAPYGSAWLSGGLGPRLSGPSPSQPLASFGDSASISSNVWVACGAPGLPGSVCSQLLLCCLGPGHYRPQQRPIALRGCVSMQRRSRHPLRSSSPAARGKAWAAGAVSVQRLVLRQER